MNSKILHSALQFRTSRSSGSGGQHVNKVATKVELLFDIEAADFLSDSQKARLKRKLANRINREGILQLQCSETRSQYRNKQLVIAQFDELIREALKPPVRRKKVPSSRKANPKVRLQKKRRHADKKALRKKIRI